jgi:NAD(P)-dependent dehydrogenase (short-subunit alcohol dehydrogenase family)
MNTTLENKVLLITGANRGIGKALVEVALRHNPKKIYAAARNTASLPDFGDARVVPLSLDITDVEQAKTAAEIASDVQILINNAGALAFASVLEGSMQDLENDMRVNYFGTLNVTQAFAPVIAAQGGGAIASMSSIIGLAPMAGVGGYSASKAEGQEYCCLWCVSWPDRHRYGS